MTRTQLDAALLPLPEVAHAGDDPAAADLPDVVDAVEVLVGVPAIGREHVEDEAVQERALAALIHHGEPSEVAKLVSDKLAGSYSDDFKFDLVNQVMLHSELSQNAVIAYRLKEIANNPNASAKLRISALSIMEFEEEYLLQ